MPSPTRDWSPAPRHATHGVNDHLSPGTSCSPTSAALTSPVSRRDGVGDFCTVDDDLGKHFFHDFYVAQLQLSTYIDCDFPGGAEHHGFVPDAGGRNFASDQGIDDVMTPAGGESIGGNPPPPPYSEGIARRSYEMRKMH